MLILFLNGDIGQTANLNINGEWPDIFHLNEYHYMTLYNIITIFILISGGVYAVAVY